MNYFALHHILKQRRRKPRPRLGKPPRVLYPRGIELSYRIALRRLARFWNSRCLALLEQQLPAIIAEADLEKRQDAWPDSVEAIMGQLEVTLDQETENFSTYALDIGQRVSKWNDREWRKTMKKVIGVEDIFQPEKYLGSHIRSFVNVNTDLISKLSKETLVNVRRIVETGVRAGDRYESIREELLEDGFTKSEARVELIARDQVGKLNGELTQLRQQDLGIQRYIWRTAGDDRVRDSHDVLDGMMCRWDDDSVYSEDDGETWKDRSEIDAYIGHPGTDFQCRCYAEAVFDDVIDQIEELEVA